MEEPMKNTKSTVLSQWLSQRNGLAYGNPVVPSAVRQALK
jgi:hypothetical protein